MESQRKDPGHRELERREVELRLPSPRELMDRARLVPGHCVLDVPTELVQPCSGRGRFWLRVHFDDLPTSIALEVTPIPGELSRTGTTTLRIAQSSVQIFAEALALAGARPNPQRRHAPRFAQRLPILAGFGGRTVPVLLVDLSLTGSFIASPQVRALERGQTVRVRLPHGLVRSGWVPARVVWGGQKSGYGGVGVEFSEPEVRARLYAVNEMRRIECATPEPMPAVGPDEPWR